MLLISFILQFHSLRHVTGFLRSHHISILANRHGVVMTVLPLVWLGPHPPPRHLVSQNTALSQSAM